MTQFQVGKTYETTSICDSECVYSFPIISRTNKTVSTLVHGERVKRGIQIREGIEHFKPFGSYSMAPTIRAAKW
jgi:hypothetical protein